MTYLASSAGALIVDRNTWTSRANQAWGPSDVWNSGNSWEYLTGYHGWVGRTYNVGESWETAYNRVYTDRYNEGVAAGAASKTTSSQAVTTNAVSSATNSVWTGTQGTLSAPRTGQAHASVQARFRRSNSGATSGTVQVRLKQAGSVIATSPVVSIPATDTSSYIGIDWTGACTSGQAFTVEYWGTASTGGIDWEANASGLKLTVGSV
jgi:hypothetical protein